MEKIILARHGEASHSVGEHVFAGGRIDNGLTENGRLDAEILAEKILELGGCDIIFHSHMKRSEETAEIIRDTIQKKTGTVLRLQAIDKMKEVDFGDFTGLTRAQTTERFPEAADRFYNPASSVEEWDFPGGENYLAVQKRIEDAIEKIKTETDSHPTAVVVGHSCLNKVLINSLRDKAGIRVTDHEINIDPAVKSQGVMHYVIHVLEWQ